MAASVGDRLWAPHPELVFVPSVLRGTQGAQAALVTLPLGRFHAGDEEIVLPQDQVRTLARVHDTQLEGVDNVCNLEEVSQPSMLHTIRMRYLRAQPQIYTRVSRIIIAVNPFQSLPIYAMDVMRQYLDATDSMELPAHIFAVGCDAIQGLSRGDSKSQAVLISGESGAGKTESTKLILSYVATAIGGEHGGIQDKIMNTNPVLEAFGNAMTVRNNNSSRFGKWLQMAVSASLHLQGCSVTDYLLELTRVCMQGERERNYHVFFQMIAARGELKDLQIGDAQSYRYLKGGMARAPGVDDLACFQELQHALTGLGIDSGTQREVYRIVVGILALGNVEFVDRGDSCALVQEQPVTVAAGLLGLDRAALEKAMMVRCIITGRDVTEAKRNAQQAANARDGLARLLYGRLFKLLIAKINAVLSEDATGSGQFFGVLDIAGFECFEKNSLEQLFINLSNEHLQQHFNNQIFKLELADYKAEGVDLAAGMQFRDNSDVIALLDAKGSILALLDEEVTVPKSTDLTFVTKVCKAFEKHARLVKPKFGGASFGVNHFAGLVTYSAEGFLEKNVDRPPEDAPQLFKTSENGVLQQIGVRIAEELAEALGRGGKVTKTVSSRFRASLASLVQKLNEAQPHFIRCIKPNQEKVPGTFGAAVVLEQLLCSGVFEAVHIRQSGYAYRVRFQDFVSRYRMLLPKKVSEQVFGPRARGDQAARARLVIEALPAALAAMGAECAKSDVVMGQTKVFARSRIVLVLDRTRDLALSEAATQIQRIWKGYKVRKIMKASKRVFDELAAWLQANRFYKQPGSEHTALAKWRTAEAVEAQLGRLREILAAVDTLPFDAPQRPEALDTRERMLREVAEVRSLKGVMRSIEPVDIERVLLRVKDLELPETPEVQQLQARLQALKVQVPLVKAMARAIQIHDPEFTVEVVAMVKKHDLHTSPDGWIPELHGAESFAELQGKMNEAKHKRQERAHADAHKAEEPLPGGKVRFEGHAGAAGTEDHRQSPAAPPANNKKRRATFTGLTEEDQVRILLRLEEDCAVFDVEGLEDGLKVATKEGIDPSQKILAQAHALFAELETKDRLLDKLQEQAAALGKSPDSKMLKGVQNLLRQAQKLGLSGPQVEEARKRMQRSVKERTRKTIKGRILEEVDTEELALANSAFDNLINFPGLLSPDVWKGHKAKSLMSALASNGGVEVMLTHSFSEIRGPLTQLPPAQEAIACAAFTNILCWMGEKPVPEVQRVTLAEAIVSTAATDTKMADEVYVQVMKQLYSNPSSRSSTRGWELMLSLCHRACPSSELFEFLHVFLLKALKKVGPELQSTVRQCIADLNLTASQDNLVDADLISLTVTLIDRTTRKVHIPSTATICQLVDVVSEQLRISKPRDFAGFMLTEGLAQHRLLPDTAVVSALLEKWAKLKEATRRDTKLLFKRRLLLHDEVLTSRDPVHAKLTFRQAVWDFLRYPVLENEQGFRRIAVALMAVERSHYSNVVAKGKLVDPGVLEQLLPEVALRNRSRSQVAQELAEEYTAWEAQYKECESKKMSVARAFAEMQKFRLFGTYYWPARQVAQEREDTGVIPDAPRRTCLVNPDLPEMTYLVSIGYYCMRFVEFADHAAKGQLFCRAFYFSKGSRECIVATDARANLCQLVVGSVDPANASKGRQPMTIVLESNAAIDIAYSIKMVQQMWSVRD